MDRDAIRRMMVPHEVAEWQLLILEAAARGARVRYDLRGNLRLHYPPE